jgi:hypothetical protein
MALLIAGESMVEPLPVAPKECTLKVPFPPAEPFRVVRVWDSTGAAFKEAPARPAPTIFKKSLRSVLSVTYYSFFLNHYPGESRYDGSSITKRLQDLAMSRWSCRRYK